MSTETYEKTAWIPKTKEEKAAVLRQMNRLIETRHFKKSKRYPTLFRFIVEETLEGRGEFLKERLLGIRVFDRPADYDTATDPIVRVTIAEIRKRIAQYYHEEAHETEMRIELLPGSYEPEFRLRHDHDSEGDPFSALPAPGVGAIASNRHLLEREPSFSGSLASLEAEARPKLPGSARSRSARYGLVAAILFVLLGGAAFIWNWTHPSAIDEFWGPVVATHRTVTFCLPKAGRPLSAVVAGVLVPEDNSGTDPATNAHLQTFRDHMDLGESVVFSDVRATLNISDLMASYNRRSSIRMDTATTLDDLRQGPSVLIGGVSNQWTMRALAPLRFHFAGSDRDFFWIADTKNPQKRDWALDPKSRYASVNRDYAIIARIHDETTGEVEVIAAGIGMSGTSAAGEFLMNPQSLEQLRRRVGAGFKERDFEAILSADVINGVAGSPGIVAVTVF